MLTFRKKPALPTKQRFIERLETLEALFPRAEELGFGIDETIDHANQRLQMAAQQVGLARLELVTGMKIELKP